MESRSPLTGRAIRQGYLDYFAARGHTIVPSMSLVPGGDQTLLFTNSGMVQFKDMFLGTGTRPYSRAVDSQKCLRVAGKHNDLEDVGQDDAHHTFFEMLGNWSFGDYYKAEAIPWAWQLLTDVWGLKPESLWVTCFEDEQGQIPRDDEAAEIWARQPGLDTAHILYFGRKDNFWEMAETGPCGPDSEIHIDLGSGYCDKPSVPGHVCRVNGDCPRFLELWNLVFIQYNRQNPTQLDPLPNKHVDTGMGFERIVSVLQGTNSTYKTDLFAPIMERIQRLAGHTDEQRLALLTPYRVIADHARAATFLIADGVVPGNIGRNYVCRMIIRRAARFGSKAGFDEPFLGAVAGAVIEEYGDVYPEVASNRQAIERTLLDEERRFHRTVDTGVTYLSTLLETTAARGDKVLDGERAFDLYATYGLPLEIARDIARETGMDVDEAGFRQALESHREVSAGGGAASIDIEVLDTEIYRRLLADLQVQGSLPQQGVEADPYAGLETEGTVLALLGPHGPVEKAGPGQRLGVVLGQHAFYVEAGGQVSDTGTVVSVAEPRWEIAVEAAVRPIAGLTVLQGLVSQGEPRVGDLAIAAVDRERRRDIMRNHTATHLLHAALRTVLGKHVRQAGSLVAPDRLRFDFTHPEPMTDEELQQVETIVQQAILANYDVGSREKPRQQAIEEGAMALFGETYGERVRTIAIEGDERFSYELCGGTHVEETGVIGAFLILSEGSVAAGIRRIEAVTGRVAFEIISQRLGSVKRVAKQLGTSPDQLEERIESLQQERADLNRELELAQLRQAEGEALALPVQDIGGITLIAGQVQSANADTLRELADRLRGRHPSSVIVLGSVDAGRPIVIGAVSSDLLARGLHAGQLVKQLASVMGGGGGGKPGMAQAGGKDAARLPEALERAAAYVRELIR